jgi:competence protein ComEA
MKTLTTLQERFGFTRNEIRVVVFLGIGLLVGGGIRWFRPAPAPPDRGGTFDYTRSDSEFAARSSAASRSSPIPEEHVKTSGLLKKAPVQPGSVNINRATKDELRALPGIGENYAARILLYRKEHGPFKTVDELVNVRGIGPKKMLMLRKYLTVE